MPLLDVDTATARLLAAAAELPFPHDLVVQAQRSVQDGAPLAAIADLIARSPSLGERLVAMARAGVLRSGHHPTTIREACDVFGAEKSVALVTALAYADLCVPRRGASIQFQQQLATRAVVASVAARAIAQRTDDALDFEAFLAALLVGSGQLVAARLVPDLYVEVLEHSDNVLPTPQVEREHLGFDHGVLDAALARAWGLPTWTSAAVGAATSPDRLPLSAGARAARLAEVLHTGYLVGRVVADRDEAGAMIELGRALQQRLGLDAAAAPTFLRSLTASVHEMAQLLGLHRHFSVDMDQVATDAVDAARVLLERLDGGDPAHVEARESGISAVGLATDPLTGLPTAASLPHLVRQAFERRAPSGMPATVGLLVVELDGLTVERAGGSGDGVLREIAARLAANVRGSDVLLRSNGDRLVLVAPSTSVETLGSVAERLRDMVRQGDNRGALGSRELTISVGGACSEGVRRAAERERIVRDADDACSAARDEGGDRAIVRAVR